MWCGGCYRWASSRVPQQQLFSHSKAKPRSGGKAPLTLGSPTHCSRPFTKIPSLRQCGTSEEVRGKGMGVAQGERQRPPWLALPRDQQASGGARCAVHAPVAQRLGLLHAVRGQDHSAVPPRLADHVPQQLAGGRIQAWWHGASGSEGGLQASRGRGWPDASRCRTVLRAQCNGSHTRLHPPTHP